MQETTATFDLCHPSAGSPVYALTAAPVYEGGVAEAEDMDPGLSIVDPATGDVLVTPGGDKVVTT